MIETNRRTDVIDILTADHKEMLDLLSDAENAAEPERRRDLTDTAIAEVMRHAIAEEMYVYPAIVEHVPNGDGDVQHDKSEHQEIVKVMKGIEQSDAAAPDFPDLVRLLAAKIRHHAHDEEANQFPKLRASLDPAKLVEIGEKVQHAKSVAPTRPHPSSPHSELFHKTVGPGVGMVDRLRDKLTGRATG